MPTGVKCATYWVNLIGVIGAFMLSGGMTAAGVMQQPMCTTGDKPEHARTCAVYHDVNEPGSSGSVMIKTNGCFTSVENINCTITRPSQLTSPSICEFARFEDGCRSNNGITDITSFKLFDSSTQARAFVEKYSGTGISCFLNPAYVGHVCFEKESVSLTSSYVAIAGMCMLVGCLLFHCSRPMIPSRPAWFHCPHPQRFRLRNRQEPNVEPDA